jgi:hypothetical protein
VTEAPSRILVSRRVALEVWVRLGAVVVGELDNALPSRPVGRLLGSGVLAVGVVEGEEVEAGYVEG